MAKIIKISPKEKLVKYLIENKGPHSIRAVSGAIAIDYKSTYNVVHKLAPEVISQDKLGNTNLIRIKLSPNREIYSVEKRRAEELLNNQPKLRIIKKYTEEMNYPFLILLVFGSYARKNSSEKSDVDLCLISDSSSKSEQLIKKLNLLSLKMDIHKFTTNEFISMIEKTTPNLGHEIVKNNVILYGIENYYNLVSKWMKKD